MTAPESQSTQMPPRPRGRSGSLRKQLLMHTLPMDIPHKEREGEKEDKVQRYVSPSDNPSPVTAMLHSGHFPSRKVRTDMEGHLIPGATRNAPAPKPVVAESTSPTSADLIQSSTSESLSDTSPETPERDRAAEQQGLENESFCSTSAYDDATSLDL
eukprot:TRINITY_DN5026_c0_g1_i1.p1 TRINITY_DN5026_c0_g1~~TRINITY_DN5026_c0_g1_i1.p1  ORF type:complete len:179 (+),score=30.43 TRINITY_DN5026_c0_g1_i1:69-539(+)